MLHQIMGFGVNGGHKLDLNVNGFELEFVDHSVDKYKNIILHLHYIKYWMIIEW